MNFDNNFYFYNRVKDIIKNNKTKIFVDMDGVIAAYDLNKPYDFLNKRPLKTNINKLEIISKLDNVELNILSVCRENKQIDEKNEWLNKYAPFFKKENRFILSKEKYKDFSSSELKLYFLKQINTSDKVIVIDDDNHVLKTISKELKDIILFQDSELVD